MKYLNKKGATINGWVEGFALLVLAVLAIGIIVVGMNAKYNQNQDPSFGVGLQTDASSTLSNLTSYQAEIENSVNKGTASFSSFGFLILSSGWDLLKFSLTLVWQVISGTWITKAVILVRLPLELGIILQVLYLLSAGIALLYILFKVNP